MTGSSMQVSSLIAAPREEIYQVFVDPEALIAWQVPGTMTGKVHAFDSRVGGGYTMSLFYPESESGTLGKCAEREDRFTTRVRELSPPAKIVQAVTFDSDDPAFAHEMMMTITLA